MSLQPGINPLEEIAKARDARQRVTTPMAPGMRTMEFRYGRDEKPLRTLPAYGPGPGEMERYRTPTAPGMTNMGGFDPSDLMARPEIRQQETRNQANMVSAPYEQANRLAAEKTNPMNAMSQNPGKAFLMSYLGKKA